MGQIIHHFADHLYAKETIIPAGEHLLQHVHKFSHLSVLAKGKVIITTDKGQQTVEGPTCLEIKAGINHGVKALTDTVWYCIHATEEKDVNKIDEVIISGSDHVEGE